LKTPITKKWAGGVDQVVRAPASNLSSNLNAAKRKKKGKGK
jgi:hypothetical protein